MPSQTLRIGEVTVFCEVADTIQKQVKGLQGRSSLSDGRGLLFPFHRQKHTTMHMASVSFPIDIVFIRDSKVAKVVHEAQPGETALWSEMASSVVEFPGGFCRLHDIKVGSPVGLSKSALAPSPTIENPEAYALGVVRSIGESVQRGQGIKWKPDVLNGGKTESAIVSKDTIAQWLKNLGVSDLPTVMEAATSVDGFEFLSQALILSGIVDFTRVSPDGENLILYRTPQRKPPRLSL